MSMGPGPGALVKLNFVTLDVLSSSEISGKGYKSSVNLTLKTSKRWLHVQEHMRKKWSAVPGLAERLSVFFVDHTGRRSGDLFRSLDSSIHEAISSDLAQTMSITVDGMTVFQLHYVLAPLPTRPPEVPTMASALGLPPAITSDVPLSMTEIGSAVLTPSMAPLAPIRGPLSFPMPLGRSNGNCDGLLLSGAGLGAAFPPVDAANALETASIHISDNTMASMLNACASTQPSAPPNNSPSNRVEDKSTPSVPPSAPFARPLEQLSAGRDFFSEVYKGTGHSPAAFAAFESAFQAVTANMDRAEGGFKTLAPTAAAASHAPASAGEGHSPADLVELSISERTMHNMLSFLCDSNAAFCGAANNESGLRSEVNGAHETQERATGNADVNTTAAMGLADGALNAVDTTQESVQGDCVSGNKAVHHQQSVSGPHTRVADAILRNSERKRNADHLIGDDSAREGVNILKRKKMRRITPTFMGPLTEAHRYIVGHFPIT